MLYELITQQLTSEQQKGIISVVFQNDQKKGGNKKFEFDLYSLSPELCNKLEAYVQSCI